VLLAKKRNELHLGLSDAEIRAKKQRITDQKKVQRREARARNSKLNDAANQRSDDYTSPLLQSSLTCYGGAMLAVAAFAYFFHTN
jgi:uncharacterized protein YaiL (DUF2058 family)